MTVSRALTRDEIHAVIWPHLADDIHHYAAHTTYPAADSFRDAEADAVAVLLDHLLAAQSTGATEVIASAATIMDAACREDD